MAKFVTIQGTTSQMVHLFVQDATATNGAGLTGLSFSASGFTMAYIREGQSAHTLVTKTGSGNLGTYVSGNWLEVSSGTMPGVYEFHVPNAAVTNSGGAGRVVFIAVGNAAMAPVPFELQLYPQNGLTTPILAATTHAGVTISNVQTCATVTRVLLVDTVSTVARCLLVDTGTVVLNVNTATSIVNPVSISAGQLFVKKNSTLPGFMFLMTDTASHAPMTGLAVTGQYALTGGSFGAMASVGAEMTKGWYSINIAAAEVNAPICSFRITAAGADDCCITLITQS